MFWDLTIAITAIKTIMQPGYNITIIKPQPPEIAVLLDVLTVLRD